MPTNKHAVIRYRTIDRCLRNIDATWTWRELAEACSKELEQLAGKEVKVSERTIKYDISAMRNNEALGYFAPIEYDRKEKTYYYSNPKYTLTESPINKSDTELLHSAVSMLEQFTEIRKATGIQNILTKLESSLDRHKSKEAPIIQFDHAVDAPGQQWLYMLYQLIKTKNTSKIRYRPFGKRAAHRIISPQLIKEYKGRWYLLAFEHQIKDARVYALDRILEISDSISEYHILESIETKKYFDQVVGVSVFKDRKLEKVQFEAFGTQVDYFLTKPMHSSQKIIRKEEDKALFEIEVIINYELMSEILSFQNNIRVVAPENLKQDIKEKVQQLSKLY